MISSWQFEKKEVDDGPGWNAPIITGFKKNKLKSLTCEILQNCLDNPLKGATDPVRVVFSQKTFQRKELPGANELAGRLKHILEQAKGNESENALEEIQCAIDCISADQVSCLQIQDFNTSGMAGPDVRGSDFHRYMKTEGSSGGSAARGGSHGHGKAAPLTVSDLRAIFVSTRYLNNDQLQSLAQGRTTLMYHEIGELKFGYHGYWGGPGFKAMENLPSNLRRFEHPEGVSGTTITILGWQKFKYWQNRIIGYALANYFPAFHRGKLEIEVAGEVINNSNFRDRLEDPALIEILRENDLPAFEALKIARWYLKCLDLEANDAGVEIKQLSPNPGKSEFRIIIEEDAPRSFAIIRNNMFICDARKLDHFYKRLPGGFQDFVGIFECKNKKGLELLRGMEPPEHNDLSADYLPRSQSEEGKSALKKLGFALRDFIKKHARIPIGEGSEVKWMKDFFDDPAGDGGEFDPSEDIDPTGKFEVTPRPKPVPPKPPIFFIEPERLSA